MGEAQFDTLFHISRVDDELRDFFMGIPDETCYHSYKNQLANDYQEQFDKLYHACKFHTTEHRSGDTSIDTCYDADRLDLGRVGIALDPKKMATSFGATIASKSLEAGIKPEDMRDWLVAYKKTQQ